jgi:hypothetical protein
MSDAELEVQRAIFETLKTAPEVVALLANSADEGSPTQPAIYDHIPQVVASEDESKFPLIGIGDDTAEPFDTDDIDGHESTVTLHIYDRYEGTKRVKQITGAVYRALHDSALEVIGQHTVYCFWEFSGNVPDPDPMTKHGVMRFRIATQQD